MNFRTGKTRKIEPAHLSVGCAIPHFGKHAVTFRMAQRRSVFCVTKPDCSASCPTAGSSKPKRPNGQTTDGCTVNGIQHGLGTDEQVAKKLFGELLADRPTDDTGMMLSVRSLTDQFLAWSQKHDAQSNRIDGCAESEPFDWWFPQ